MKVLLACLLVAAVTASQLGEQGVKFQAFKVKHGKTYKNQVEETKRFNIFEDNLRAIEEHNALYEHGLSSYKKGITQFADMTHEEFKAMLTFRTSKKPHFNTTKHVKTGLAIPDSVDWRDDGQVTGVKDQGLGYYSACWSFSITGVTEAAYKRSSGNLVSLSEHQLVDCTLVNGESYLEESFPYIEEYGLQSEDSYLSNASLHDCKYSADSVVTKISGYKSIEFGDEDALLDAVANVGPVAVGIGSTYLELYDSGIFESNLCYDGLDHAVLIVGYGSEDNKDFWIVKNSWGTSFGENGFFRILRGRNECGIAENACYPIV